MKLFERLRGDFEITGIYSVQNQQKQLFNLKNVFLLLMLVQFFISSAAFLLFQEKSANEFVYAFYWSTTSFAATLLFLVNILKKEKMFKLINNCEQIIQNS